MAECPVCQSPLPDDFGLVDCPSCQAGLFIEFDGFVRQREDGDLAELPPENAVATPVAQPKDSATGLSRTAYVPGSRVAEIGLAEATDGNQEESVMQALEAAEEGAIDLGPYLDEEVPMEPAPPVTQAVGAPDSGRPDMTSIVNFGNQPPSLGRESAYLYDLELEGIDSAEVREEILAAMNDKLFLWDAQELMRSTSDGTLRLADLTPVKAAVLVQRLLHLPIQIRWVQRAIASS